MVHKVGSLVITSLGFGIVGSQLSSATGTTAGSTLTGKFLEGTGKVVQPVLKVKGASLVVKSISKLRKPKKLKTSKSIF